ncbi:aldehyde dehydrogenase (NADP(+)) [Amorphus orientalis]|uniref:NADP-dependent aldehyde dehydrogenase n=1 Tax=Amorphus orientalis TaxID=649198 RepID=A0AAE4ARW5_9HYPH|nr:aldehyde dehydrogenase (NADP(+)) [Amorphus orientalis]MDQ0314310.1 NADP-dependent aldehyde dehydrogenase [Amorphus orientalis]
MSFTPHGNHLIAGDWRSGSGRFSSKPATGPASEFALGTAADVDAAVTAAEEAFWTYGASSREARAAFLEAIADEIEARADQITDIGSRETGLPEARLQGERGRTTGQLRLFAGHIRAGDYLDRRHDAAQPDRQPGPRPDLRLIQRPLGPVGVFGASNFPLAFSTAGGDTASALAAGCPVVVKGHPSHPGTGEIVAEAILAAIKSTGQHPGVFSLIQSNTNEAGTALVQHPLITAIGFTGSLRGGRALFDLANRRETPIPFFGELGSVNPVFVLPDAARARASEIGTAWAGSLSMGVGQFCTNPGIVLIEDGDAAEAFETAAAGALSETGPQTMLSEGIAEAYRTGRDKLSGVNTLREKLRSNADGRAAAPDFYVTDGQTFLANPELGEEVFGPFGLLVRVTGVDQMVEIAGQMDGQLTCTLHMDAGDHGAAGQLMPILERKAGRILANGFPTGVEVADAMMHGGPYPASTNPSTTSVGTLAIRRFLRPVCYQNIPEDLLPEDLR